MQRERMLPGEAYVPSLREYAARYGVTPRARAARPARHAPGADEPRRRDRGEVADWAPSLIDAQVRAGLVVRMAVLYDLLAGGDGGGVRGGDASQGG